MFGRHCHPAIPLSDPRAMAQVDMAHYVTESPFFVFGVFTVFVFGIYFSNFFESSILRIWCV